MGKKQNVIEINGRRYDAHSGLPLDEPASTGPAVRPTAVTPIATSAVPVRSLAKPVTKKTEKAEKSERVEKVEKAALKSAKMPHSAVKTIGHHHQQGSKTLMRRAVKKPGESPKRRVKVQIHTGLTAPQAKQIEQAGHPKRSGARIKPKLSLGNTDPRRLAHAKKVQKSSRIRHFNPHPANRPEQRVTVNVARTKKPSGLGVARPKPVPRQTESDIDEIFERAIQQATSHLEPAPKKPKKHRFGLGRKHARA